MNITQFEDLAAAAETAFNINLDGAYAAGEMTTFVTPEQVAQDFLYDPSQWITEGAFRGLYDVFQKRHGENRFNEMRTLLSGRALLASIPIEGRPTLAPAGIVDESVGLRVTILQTGAKLTTSGEVIADQVTLLSGAAQINNPNIGQHNRFANKAEAGHLLTGMAGALQPSIGQKIAAGNHIVHELQETNTNIAAFVTHPRSGRALLPTPLVSRQFTYQTWPAGLRLFAHRPQDGEVGRLDTPNAVQLIQGIGYGTLVQAGAVNQALALADRMG